MSIIKMMLSLMFAYVLRTLQHLQEGNVVVSEIKHMTKRIQDMWKIKKGW